MLALTHKSFRWERADRTFSRRNVLGVLRIWFDSPPFFQKTIAATSTAPSKPQQIDLLCSPANQYPKAALKQRAALVHPLAHAAGLLSIFRSFIWILLAEF
jgi:hypothetical protein